MGTEFGVFANSVVEFALPLVGVVFEEVVDIATELAPSEDAEVVHWSHVGVVVDLAPEFVLQIESVLVARTGSIEEFLVVGLRLGETLHCSLGHFCECFEGVAVGGDWI